MSDTSQGPGWWKASDGKWYSPDLYPTDWPAANPSQATESTESTPSDGAAEISEPAVDEPAPTADPGGPPAWSPPASDPPADVPLAQEASAPPAWDPPGATAEPPAQTEPPPLAAPSLDVPPVEAPSQVVPPEAPPIPAAPSGWAAPDPAAGEPTLVQGIDPVPSLDPTAVHSVLPTPPPVAPPGAPAPPDPNVPVAPLAPPSTWDAPSAPPSQPQAAPVETERASGDLFGGLLGLAGGAGLIVGSFLAWAKAGGTLTSGTVNGLTGSNGWGTLVAGLVVASAAGLLMAGVRKSWVAAGVILAALAGLGLAVYSYIDIGNTSDDLPGALSAQGVGEEIANGAVLHYDVGLWIVLGGAALSLLAGLIALARRR